VPQPAVEVLRAPAEAQPKVESGVSAVRDVTLGPGLPELSKGRRPVPPPFARMAGVSGTVLVRFAIDAAGGVSIQGSDGPDLLRPAAEQAVVSWVFRRTATDRLRAVAEITYKDDAATAAVRLEQ
jgi:outer membrane biosynthesis protein TonB